jgi:hypothetical protein
MFRNDPLLHQYVEKVSEVLRFTPPIVSDKVIADIQNLLDTQMKIPFHKGLGSDIICILGPGDVISLFQVAYIVPQK